MISVKKLMGFSLILLLVSASVPFSAEARVMKIVNGQGGGTLYPGDTIVTDSNSTALLLLSNGGTVSLSPNSQFTIKQSNTFELSFGRLRAEFQKILTQRVKILTPTSVTAVRGTEFTIEVDSNNVTKVAVFGGEVEVTDPISNNTVLLTENQTIEMPEVPGGLSELEMQQKIEVFDPLSVDRWWEEAKPIEPRVSGGDVDLLPDLVLNYTHVWPAEADGLNIFGISNYELIISVEETVYVDFTFTYVADEDTEFQVYLLNKMPLIEGWLHQFDFVNPPTSNIGSMQLIDDTHTLVGAGYSWSQFLNSGEQLIISGRLVLINETAVNLFDSGLANKNLHSASYVPIVDIIVIDGQSQLSSLDIWDTFGIPMSKIVLDTVREMNLQEDSFNQEKSGLQSQLSDVQGNLLSKEEQVATLESTLNSVETENSDLKTLVSSLENDIGILQNEVSVKESSIDSIQSQLDQNQTIIYGSIGVAILFLLVAVMLFVRKRN